MAFLSPVPYSFLADDPSHFWVHVVLCGAGFLLAVITVAVQWKQPAPYGKHEGVSVKNWGPQVPQRLCHMISDTVPGVLLFLLVFFLYGTERGAVNFLFLAIFQLHCLHRGLFHPLLMRYRNPKVALGISVGTFFPNCLYHYLSAEFVGFAKFSNTYFYDPRFILGVLLFCLGFVVNRWADLRLRALRSRPEQARRYRVPHGGLFQLIACPNYFGEMVQWLGWALATFSLSGLVWFLFACATFVPRSRHHLQWYRNRFEDFPKERRALIPFIF